MITHRILRPSCKGNARCYVELLCMLKVFLYDVLIVSKPFSQMGALALKRDSPNNDNDDGELTFLGRVLAYLPVDLHLGKLIALGHVFGCMQESLIIGQWEGATEITLLDVLAPTMSFKDKLIFEYSQKNSIHGAYLSLPESGPVQTAEELHFYPLTFHICSAILVCKEQNVHRRQGLSDPLSYSRAPV